MLRNNVQVKFLHSSLTHTDASGKFSGLNKFQITFIFLLLISVQFFHKIHLWNTSMFIYGCPAVVYFLWKIYVIERRNYSISVLYLIAIRLHKDINLRTQGKVSIFINNIKYLLTTVKFACDHSILVLF